MGSLLIHGLEINFSNRTKDITLRNPKTFFECGSCSGLPPAQLCPGSSDISRFKGSFPFWGVAGILVYEAESFTLAIYFSNPIDYNKFSMELGLELSMSKAHRGSVADAYTRMAKGAYSSSCLDTKSDRVTVANSHGITQGSDSPIKVMAAMSTSRNSILKVQWEEQCGTEGRGQDPDLVARQRLPGEMRRCRTFSETSRIF